MYESYFIQYKIDFSDLTGGRHGITTSCWAS